MRCVFLFSYPLYLPIAAKIGLLSQYLLHPASFKLHTSHFRVATVRMRDICNYSIQMCNTLLVLLAYLTVHTSIRIMAKNITHFENQNELDNTTGENHSGKHANNPVRVLTARSIIGDKVTNPAGEDLGKIADIMLNIDDGRIEYVIIAFGGFLGFSQKYFAVPLEALSVDTKHHAFLLDQSRAAFESNPGFDKNHWPDANFHAESTRNYRGFMGANTGSDH